MNQKIPIPDDTHYKGSYLGSRYERFHSYQFQLGAVSVPAPASILVIGVGDGIVCDCLQKAGYQVKTLDLAEDLSPDYLADVRDIPLKNNSYDVVICCQVLEHLPFDDVASAAREIGRVAKRQVIISLPDQRRIVGFNLNVIGRRLNFQMSLPRLFPKPIERDRFLEMGHYWEINYKGASFYQVLKSITPCDWTLSKSERVASFTWHTFFIFHPT